MTDDIIGKIRDALPPEIMDQAYDYLFDRFLELLDPWARKKLGARERRVMSFGPYSGDGEVIIDEVASKIAQIGYVGMTFDSYYSPSDPKTRHSLRDAIPAFFQLQEAFPTYVYLQHLPRLASRAVFFENDERGQADELRGCFKFKIPRLGYILHQFIYAKDRPNSTFLELMGRYSECKASHRNFCGHSKDGNFCPFYDSISIPWTSLQLFLTRDSTIVAVRSLDELERPLKLFLRHGVSKPRI